MKDPEATKEIILSLDNRTLTLEISIRDKEVIEALLDGLSACVEEGKALKIRQTYMTSRTDSLRMICRIITKAGHMEKWRHEIRQLISLLRKKGV